MNKSFLTITYRQMKLRRNLLQPIPQVASGQFHASHSFQRSLLSKLTKQKTISVSYRLHTPIMARENGPY